MEFLSRLAGNLPILIIVLTGLLSLYKKYNSPKGNQPGKARPRPASPMPTFGGGPNEQKRPVRKLEPNPWEEEHQKRQQAEESQRREEALRRERQAEEERRALQDVAQSDATYEGFGAPRRSPFQTDTANREAGSRNPSRNVNRGSGGKDIAASAHAELVPGGEELAKAVVWSEILGPPRSKRPYGR